MQKINIDHLGLLRGEQLSSVIFVQDYLQLDFDGNRLTCYKWPQILVGNSLASYGEPEYRNFICSLIASDVLKIKSTENSVAIEFETGEILFNMPDQSEVIHFRDCKGRWSYYPTTSDSVG